MCGLGSFFKGRSQPSPWFPLVNTASLLLTVFVGVTVNALIGAFVGSSVNDVHSRRLIHRIPKRGTTESKAARWTDASALEAATKTYSTVIDGC